MDSSSEDQLRRNFMDKYTDWINASNQQEKEYTWADYIIARDKYLNTNTGNIILNFGETEYTVQ